MALKGKKGSTSLLLLFFVFFIAPFYYLEYGEGMDNPVLFGLSLLSLAVSMVMLVLYGRKTAGYQCKQCGKKFNRR